MFNKITLTKKEMLTLLDVLIFVHTKFHSEEFSMLNGHPDETRVRLRSKVVENIVEILSDNKKQMDIEFSDIDIENIITCFNNFILLGDYEKEGRFTTQDILDLENKLTK